ncbi:putative elongation factor 1-gamma (EF-1-gamma) [Trypanosoma cruzi]|nr:putative elongation factor 1-gamma (EF-1-gamma) [Trypanosoma cruzi]
MQKKDNKMQCMTNNMVGRVVAAHGARAPVIFGCCADDCGGEAARHCGAVCVVWPGHGGDCEGRGGHGAAGLRKEVADVVAQREGPTIPRPVLQARVEVRA